MEDKPMTAEDMGEIDPPCDVWLGRNVGGFDWRIDCVRLSGHRGKHKTVAGREFVK